MDTNTYNPPQFPLSFIEAINKQKKYFICSEMGPLVCVVFLLTWSYATDVQNTYSSLFIVCTVGGGEGEREKKFSPEI